VSNPPFPNRSEWPLGQRIAFRLLFAYIVLYLAGNITQQIYGPLVAPWEGMEDAVWGRIVPFVAKHVLRLSDTNFAPDADDIYHWIQVLCCAALAVAVTVVWSVADRRRPNYAKLHQWFRVGIRYVLAVGMFTYGSIKIFGDQFVPPHLGKLIETYGDSSPISLLWTYMGASPAYTAFAGGAEMLGGLLLLSRRTTTLGALILIAALSNVVMIDLSYDVSVKLWSMHLLLLASVLVLPDLGRLANMLVLNRPVERVAYPPLIARPLLARFTYGAAMAGVVFTMFARVTDSIKGHRAMMFGPRNALYGIYNVESFARNGTMLPPLLTDSTRWRQLVIERSGMASVRLMNDVIRDFATRADTARRTLVLVANPDTSFTTAGWWPMAFKTGPVEDTVDEAVKADSTARQSLRYSRPTGDRLTLGGSWGKDSIDVQLRRVDESRFMLVSRGFHWIQPRAFFR